MLKIHANECSMFEVESRGTQRERGRGRKKRGVVRLSSSGAQKAVRSLASTLFRLALVTLNLRVISTEAITI